MNPLFKEYLLDVTKASNAEEIQLIQSLWSGYGKISRYRLFDSSLRTVVVKNIQLSKVPDHPRGWDTPYSHNRKVHSYKVETHWYEHWSRECTSTCRVPQYLGSYYYEKDRWIILEDLDEHYPERKHDLSLTEVKTCLSWLAHFHATFIQRAPTGLWKIGTYWNLDTRPDEYSQMKESVLKSKAHAIDSLLNHCTFQTIVHGDAKVANFCFSKNGLNVAAVDFQYVGGGCGMKDVAYFLGSCLSSDECFQLENELLQFYFSELTQKITTINPELNTSALEEEWRALYPIACADFIRFLIGWMPDHRKINAYNLKIMENVLNQLKT